MVPGARFGRRITLVLVLLVAAGCGDDAGSTSASATYRFCAGMAFRYPQALVLATADGPGADPGRSRGSRRWLRAIFNDEFAAGARAGDRALARAVRQGADDAQDGGIPPADLARYQQAHRDLEVRNEARCPP